MELVNDILSAMFLLGRIMSRLFKKVPLFFISY
jgi:hypothetical protein